MPNFPVIYRTEKLLVNLAEPWNCNWGWGVVVTFTLWTGDGENTGLAKSKRNETQ